MKVALALLLMLSVACGEVPGQSKDKDKDGDDDKGDGAAGDDANGDDSATNDGGEGPITYKDLPEGLPAYGFSLTDALAKDGEMSANDVTVISCFQGRPLPADLTEAEFQGYTVIEETGLTDAFKDIELSNASSTTHQVVLLKLKGSTVSHMGLAAMDPKGIYCLDLQDNDFSFLTVNRDCSSVVSVHMANNKVSHYNWTPNLWGEDGADPCHTATAATLTQDVEPDPTMPPAPEEPAVVATEGEYFDLKKALEADGELSAIDAKLVECFKTARLPADLTAEDVRNYAIYDYDKNEIGHSTFVNDLSSSERPRLAYIKLTENTVSHAHVNLMNEKGIYCMDIARNDFSFLNFRRSCKAVVKATFTENTTSWILWADDLIKMTEDQPVCGDAEVDGKAGTL